MASTYSVPAFIHPQSFWAIVDGLGFFLVPKGPYENGINISLDLLIKKTIIFLLHVIVIM